MDNKNQENLQSRREFFKKTAKGVLPILGISLFGASILTSCEKEKEEVKYGCNGCSGSCSSGCSGSCDSGCSGSCDNSCSGTCDGCTGGCDRTSCSGM